MTKTQNTISTRITQRLDMLHLHLPSFLKLKHEDSTNDSPKGSRAHEPLPSPIVGVVLEAWDAHDWNNSSDAMTDWLNARWAKSGYSVKKEVVCYTLRLQGRDARMNLGDPIDGAFRRE